MQTSTINAGEPVGQAPSTMSPRALSWSVGEVAESAAAPVRGLRLPFHAMAALVALFEGSLIIAASLAAGIAFHLAVYDQTGALSRFVGVGVINAFGFVLLSHALRLYSLPALIEPQRVLVRTVIAWAGTLLLLFAAVFMIRVGTTLSRGALGLFAAAELSVILGVRHLAARYIRRCIAEGALRGQRAVLVGDADQVVAWDRHTLLTAYGIEEVARVDLAATGDMAPALDGIIDTARAAGAQAIVVALPWADRARLSATREHLRRSPLSVKLLPCSVVRATLALRASPSDMPLLVELQREPLNVIERAAKRAFDVVIAGAALAMLLPVFLLLGLAIKIESAGPALFRQRRNGFDAKQFTILKFRSMRVQEDGPRVVQATRNDPRVTRLGRFMRRTSVDELPQLINVLVGHMSIIGPRPHALAHDNEYTQLIGNYAYRHHMKPGITGWAQVNGYRGETAQVSDMAKRVEFDLWYIENWSLWLDVRILFRTAREVLKGNAY